METLVRRAQESDAAGMARAFVDSMRSAYQSYYPANQLRFTYEESERNWRRTLREMAADDQSKECIYVAEAIDATAASIVGVVMGGPDRASTALYQGEIYVIGLLPAYHGRGLGRAMMTIAAEQLAQYGLKGLLVRVLSVNKPARGFYEALGGTLVLEERIEDEGIELDQVGYGWTEWPKVKHEK